ncbi:MAG: hypothetical protein K0B05_11330, partial [Bacteroidales bacterium]|nr:hypothetical protein [Bacteroidales bacterium]
TLSREGLALTGPVVAYVTARAVEPVAGSYAGIIVRLDGTEPHDRTPPDDPAENPLSPGIPNFNFYSLEVVQRIGYDSFCPDNGVLLAKNKDKESRNGGPNGFNCFNWVIDAHPEDINMVDYIRPDGTPVMRTIADYRQLNDALFHAGLNSGSHYEWTDEHNRLHFYIIDLQRNGDGILVYKLGVRSLDGSRPQKRGVELKPPAISRMKESAEYHRFSITNTGEKNGNKETPGDHDIYRLSAEVSGGGWSVRLLNALASLRPGETEDIPVYVSVDKNGSGKATVTVTAQSESNPSEKAVSVYQLKAGKKLR